MDAVALDTVSKIARTCLYEGYLLWPYRRSALKNARRWTFGCVYPERCAPSLGERDRMRTEVLLETGHRAAVTVTLRFLHVVDRRVFRDGPDGPEPVDELTVDGTTYLSWQEATEREVVLPRLGTPGDGPPCRTAVDIPAGEDREPLTDRTGRRAGTVVRSWRRLTGTVETAAVPVARDVLRLSVRIVNTTPCPRLEEGARHARDEAAGHAFVSTHTVLHADGGRFVSLIDPPPPLREAAAGCRNDGTWPVLVGGHGREGHEGGQDGHDNRRSATVLSSPITLYDFPAVAPESPGDLFDGTEIDRLLILSVLSLTEQEQAEARACDPRAREILDRCAALGEDELLALHGTIREFRPLEAT